MKKLTTLSLTALSILALVACSSGKQTEQATSKPVETTKAETPKETTSKDDSQYQELVDKLNNQLNPDGNAEFETKVEHDVIDSDYPDGHTIIRIIYTGEGAKTLADWQEAIDSNTATADQKNAISLLQLSISQLAKELPDDTTTLDVGYEIAADQYRLVAKSSKVKDIIPINDLVME